MNPRIIASSTLASLLALGLASGSSAHSGVNEDGKEKCYGVAKAGHNDCANLSGTHACAGQALVDADPGEWKYVAKGSCALLGGLSETAAAKKAEPKQ